MLTSLTCCAIVRMVSMYVNACDTHYVRKTQVRVRSLCMCGCSVVIVYRILHLCMCSSVSFGLVDWHTQIFCFVYNNTSHSNFECFAFISLDRHTPQTGFIWNSPLVHLFVMFFFSFSSNQRFIHL